MTTDVILWAIGVGAAVIAWAVRVEARVQAHERDIARMTHDTERWRAEMRADLAEMKDALQYIRERLDATHR